MKCLERNLGITAIHSIFKEIPTDQELAKSLHTAITKGNAKVIGDSTTPPETSIILDFTGQAYNLPKPNTDERCLMELLQLHNNVSTIMLRLDFSDKSHKQQLQQLQIAINLLPSSFLKNAQCTNPFLWVSSSTFTASSWEILRNLGFASLINAAWGFPTKMQTSISPVARQDVSATALHAHSPNEMDSGFCRMISRACL